MLWDKVRRPWRGVGWCFGWAGLCAHQRRLGALPMRGPPPASALLHSRPPLSMEVTVGCSPARFDKAFSLPMDIHF